MGQIKSIRDQVSVGTLSRVTEIGLDADSTELGLILASIRQGDCEIEPQVSPDPSNDPEEVCQVPRSDLEGEAKSNGGVDWRAMANAADRDLGEQRKRWEIQEASLSATRAHLDDARGAARIMADALGLENSDRSHVAKLIKQCLSLVEVRRDEYRMMGDEMANMAQAMARFGFDVYDPYKDEAVHKYCQRLAHGLDTAKREGWRLGQVPESDSVSEGRAVAHLTDEQRMKKVGALQNEMGKLMEDGAMAGGFIKEGMPRGEYVEGLQKWAVYVGNKRRVDQELARMAKESPPEVESQPAPPTDAEKLAARTKPVEHKVTVKVDFESEEEAKQRRGSVRAATVEVPTNGG